jgi:hypothetical protein
MTPEQVRALRTPELVALYNRLTGKSVKRFSSRSKGEGLVIKALANRPPAASTRVVNGHATGRSGRPKAQYAVQLTEEKAKSKPYKDSTRAALIAWLRSKGSITVGNESLANAATIDSIETHFGKRMRGVVQKLLEKSWLKKIELAGA